MITLNCFRRRLGTNWTTVRCPDQWWFSLSKQACIIRLPLSSFADSYVSRPQVFPQDIRSSYPGSKVHRANMGRIWGQQDPGGPHVDPMNFVIWVYIKQELPIFSICNDMCRAVHYNGSVTVFRNTVSYILLIISTNGLSEICSDIWLQV